MSGNIFLMHFKKYLHSFIQSAVFTGRVVAKNPLVGLATAHDCETGLSCILSSFRASINITTIIIPARPGYLARLPPLVMTFSKYLVLPSCNYP